MYKLEQLASMSSKIKFAGPSNLAQPAPILLETDWTKCVICQGEKDEKLVCPAESLNQGNIGAGYVKLAEDVTAFNDVNCLPKQFDISRINDGDGIKATLQRYKAKFHSTCRLEYSKSRLQRAMKRKCLDEDPTTSSGTNLKKPCREYHSRRQAKGKDDHLCPFCEKPASPSEPLHEAMTKNIGERIKRCATKLLDEKLLAKVSSGDLIASEAKYHAKCLVAFYNAAAQSKMSEKSDDKSMEKHYARAFAELLAFIEETLANREEQTPVFKLSDLVQLYKDRLVQLKVISPSVHSTRIKDRILAHFPELQAFKEGRDILMKMLALLCG